MTKSAVPETCPMYTWTLSASNFCHFLLMTSVNHCPQSLGSPSCESHSILLPCHLQTEVSGKNPLSGVTETQLLQTDLLGQACAYGKCHLIQSSRKMSLGSHWSVSSSSQLISEMINFYLPHQALCDPGRVSRVFGKIES